MAEGKRLSKMATELNVGINSIVEFLQKKGYKTEDFNPNTKLDGDQCALLESAFSKDKTVKHNIEKINEEQKKEKKEKKETISIEEPAESEVIPTAERLKGPAIVGNIKDLMKPKPQPQSQQQSQPKPQEAKKVEEPKKQPAPAPAPTPAPEAKKEAPKVENKPAPKPEVPKAEPKVEAPKPVAQPANVNKPQEVKKENKPADPKPVVAQSKQPIQQPKVEEPKPAKKEEEIFRLGGRPQVTGPTVIGKIQLPISNDNDDNRRDHKKKRQRTHAEKVDINTKTINQVNNNLKKDKEKKNRDNNNNSNNNNNNNNNGRQNQNGQGGQNNQNQGGKKNKKQQRLQRQEVNEEDVQKQIKDTLARLTAKGAKSKTSKHRREKRELVSQREAEEQERLEDEKKVLKVTEFVTANELATMMNEPINKVIATFMSLGMFVSINQRLDAESLSIVAEEFGFKVEFVSVESASEVEEEDDDEAQLTSRPPIVTVMGHVDHGKTSLLDYIRNTNVISGEAGGITQHIGAYNVTLENGRHITFLDTPGHEAFTAMRARGAQVTDVAIIIVAADDSVMPQTIEAINHAAAANVPIVFAINKIDKPGANPDKIREALANMNYLVEEWGGKYQCQEISAKKGINVDKLLDKVLLEADMLELKANPNRRAMGHVIESSLDKGRGYQATLLVSNGTLHVGDMVVCGYNYGRVKAMFNERNQKVEKAGPSEPVLVLGLNGAPQAGEKFNVFADEKEAKDIANKRDQLQREQAMRATPHMTLSEIGRRIAIGNFQELNIIVKGDVDGSVEALSDSLIKLSTEEIKVNVIHKAVGQISETDITLASASDAIVVGFQVRPSAGARKMAEKEKIDIRLYSIIYDAIEEIKSAMEGMLSPEIREQVTGTLEVQQTFKISKVGTIAGCIVKEGKVKAKSKVRVIRDGIVVYTGELGSLKRFKDEVKEVVSGLDCGLSINNYNDILVGDTLEAYEEIEISRKL
ncbi:MAG: translation initiation factor IF-2 [Bacteroidales bacterium]|nr:translation initiation factor IF-2 [Bacteroidales bacterium]